MENENDRLAPLLFLKGLWDGEGNGPYGPYRLAAKVEPRGRWLLLTSEIIDPSSKQVTYVSTQVYGYGESGLLLHFFDTAGSFVFAGKQTGDGLVFDWKDGENWKRSQYWAEAGGKVRFRYESVYPKGSSELYEGHWVQRSASSQKAA